MVAILSWPQYIKCFGNGFQMTQIKMAAESPTYRDSASANSLRPTRKADHFADDIFRFILVYENYCKLIQISRKFVPKMHAYVTRSQCVSESSL